MPLSIHTKINALAVNNVKKKTMRFLRVQGQYKANLFSIPMVTQPVTIVYFILHPINVIHSSINEFI